MRSGKIAVQAETARRIPRWLARTTAHCPGRIIVLFDRRGSGCLFSITHASTLIFLLASSLGFAQEQSFDPRRPLSVAGPPASTLEPTTAAGGATTDPDRQASDPPTVYCSVDEPFARSVLAFYEKRTGITPRVVFDSEAGKTTGLVNRIFAEAQSGRVRADVLWSSELFHTIRLARSDLLEHYDSPPAADIPPRFRDPGHRWTALAVRARVIAFDPKRTPIENVPRRWEDISSAAIAPKVAIARPLFGTTHGHVAAMFALWGPDRANQFLENLATRGALVADGNSSAVRALISGRVEFAVTDSDDVFVAARAGASVDLVYPDMGDGGTLLVPTSVALIRGGPSPEAAKQLVDFLVSDEVERMLAASPSGNVPVREKLRLELGMNRPPESKVDFHVVADHMDEAFTAAREILTR